MSNAEFSRHVGVSSTYIGNLLRDYSSNATSNRPPRPSEPVVEKIAEALHVPLDEARLAAGYAPVREFIQAASLNRLNKLSRNTSGLPLIPQPVRLRLPVAEYYRLYELGLIAVEDFERSEIIDGELVRKMSIGDKHAWVVDFLTRFFILNLPDSIRVQGQNPLRLNDYDEPEPDIVLSDLTKYDGRRHPTPAETILVVEVAESSLRIDRNTKLPLYAEAGISEFWIVNIRKQIVEVYTSPEFGMYRSVEIFKLGSIISSGVLPDLSLTVDELLS